MIRNDYWAGLFDGEGSIYIAKDLIHMQVSITQKETDILYLLKKEFGGGVTKYGKQTCHKWRVTSVDTMKKFLLSIEPYSIIKRGEIIIALEFLNGMRANNRQQSKMDEQEREERQTLFDKLVIERHC